MVKIGVIFYSTYGHTYELARKIAEGAAQAGAEVHVRRIPETLSQDELSELVATEAGQKLAAVPVVSKEELAGFDGIALGGPTRFGTPSAQVQSFIEGLSSLWREGSTVGKFATVFGCSSSQHGGNETTLLFQMIPLFHFGFCLVGLPSTYKGLSQGLVIAGGTSFGITSVCSEGLLSPNAVELDGAYFQGKHFVQVIRSGFSSSTPQIL